MRKLLVILLALTLFASPAAAKDYYVSINRGKGKKGTKEKPAKDLGNLIKKLAPGDTVHIAGGTYLGRGKTGANLITVPVSIIGGYDDTFSSRDPWGKHRTVFYGFNQSKNYSSGPSLMIDLAKYKEKNHPILVDGIIIDHAGRNRYKTDKEQKVLAKADPKTGKNPSPSLGSLVIRVGKSEKFDRGPRWKITVQNCILMNSITTQGVLNVGAFKDSEVTIRNNLVINNSGFSIFAGSKFHGDGAPKFLIENNTVLFTWRHFINNETGSSFGSDHNVVATLRNNVFAVADRYGVNNGLGAKLLLVNNNIVGNLAVDYREKGMQIAWEDVEDEAELLDEDSEDNVQEALQVPVSKGWAAVYAARVVVDREKIEAEVGAKNTPANELRRILGLPLDGGTIKDVSGPCFVHRMPLEDAIKAGSKQYGGRGCSKPSGK